jgi:hypothetical protein
MLVEKIIEPMQDLYFFYWDCILYTKDFFSLLELAVGLRLERFIEKRVLHQSG